MRHLLAPLLIGLAACGAAEAATRAVLVGVADYSTLDADLRGPANDVALMAEVLVARGVVAADVTVLASGTVPALPQGVQRGIPTAAGIRAALAAVAAASGPGDTVVFHFSGHGSQAPDLSGDEPGGYDEILLPMDAAGWKGGSGAVENALLDDELQLWAQSVLDRGAALVGVIDACHSATGFRTLGGQGRARVLDPAALGIPDDLPLAEGVAAAPLRGNFVFLYSSQSDQRSFEYPLAEPEGPWFGAFTLALAQVLRDAPEASWAQVLAAASTAMTRGAVRQDPDGEGPMLAAGVFGAGGGVPRHAVTNGEVQAGLLQGLADGAVVGLYPAPVGGEPLMLARLTGTGADRAALTGEGPMPPTAWAEVVSPAAPPPLRLALPADAPLWVAPLAGAQAAGLFLPAGAEADLRAVAVGDGLALVGGDGVLDPAGPLSSPRVTPRAGESRAEALARLLEVAGHGLRLRAVLAGLAGRGLSVGGPPVALEVAARAGQPTPGGCGTAAPLAPADPAQGMTPCDELWLTLTNRSGKPQDVTVLYQGRDLALLPIWPVAGLSNRLAPGEAARVGLRLEAPEDGGGGMEDILVLAVPVTPGTPRSDLTALATPQRLRAGTGAVASQIAALLDPDQTRAFQPRRVALALLRQPVRLLALP